MPLRRCISKASGRTRGDIMSPRSGILERKLNRIWLGTFAIAEEAACAYDTIACELHDTKVKTNFLGTRLILLTFVKMYRNVSGNENSQSPNTSSTVKSLSREKTLIIGSSLLDLSLERDGPTQFPPENFHRFR